MPGFLTDLSLQSWIVLSMFALYIIYMLFMTYSSTAYRQAMNINGTWMFVYTVMIVLAYTIIVTVGVGCASKSTKNNANLCALWSWLITALVVFGVLYTIFMSLYANSVYKKKEAFIENAADLSQIGKLLNEQ